MSLLLVVEWAGSACGITGAALIASNTRHSPWGWWLFLFSSLLLCGYAVAQQAWGILALHACFVCTNVLGLLRVWWPHFTSRRQQAATPRRPPSPS